MRVFWVRRSHRPHGSKALAYTDLSVVLFAGHIMIGERSLYAACARL